MYYVQSRSLNFWKNVKNGQVFFKVLKPEHACFEPRQISIQTDTLHNSYCLSCISPQAIWIISLCLLPKNFKLCHRYFWFSFWLHISWRTWNYVQFNCFIWLVGHVKVHYDLCIYNNFIGFLSILVQYCVTNESQCMFNSYVNRHFLINIL